MREAAEEEEEEEEEEEDGVSVERGGGGNWGDKNHPCKCWTYLVKRPHGTQNPHEMTLMHCDRKDYSTLGYRQVQTLASKRRCP